MSTLNQIVSMVKQPDFYVPRDYQTIGGMWTVDTWKRGDVTVKLMDEGYTTVVEAPGVKVVSIPRINNEVFDHFEKGTEADLDKLLETLV